MQPWLLGCGSVLDAGAGTVQWQLCRQEPHGRGYFPFIFSMDEKEKLNYLLFAGGEIQSVAGTELSKSASNTGLYITYNAIKPQCPGGLGSLGTCLSSPQKPTQTPHKKHPKPPTHCEVVFSLSLPNLVTTTTYRDNTCPAATSLVCSYLQLFRAPAPQFPTFSLLNFMTAVAGGEWGW